MGVTDALEVVPLDGRLGSAAMEASSHVGGVTPEGIREGDRAALQALVERRGPSVMAFCTRVCGPKSAERASAEAFARFRAAVRDAIDLSAVEPEALLRGATRHAAAAMARTPTGPPPHGRLRSRGTQTCEHVPTMLAARANGALGEADLERLARHLDRCERCNAMADIFRSAEAAYAEPAVDTLGTETQGVLMSAMLAVPETAIGVAPEPLPGAPAAEPQDGAFGHLPELDDEVPVTAPAPTVVPEVVPEAVVLAVAQVAEPADALDAEALVAEPLPEAEPELNAGAELEAEPEAEAELDAGAELEAEAEAELHASAEPDVAAEADLDAAADPAAQPALGPDATIAFDALEEAEPDEEQPSPELPVEQVVEPAEELHADALAAEPLPAAEPAVGEHEVDLGETVEWDMVPVHLERRSHAEAADGSAVAAPGAGAAARVRRQLAPLAKVVLPVLLVAAFAVAALALTGVIGGGDYPAPPVSRPAATAPRVQKPVLTPLPVTVGAASTTSPDATTASGAATTAGDAPTSPASPQLP